MSAMKSNHNSDRRLKQELHEATGQLAVHDLETRKLDEEFTAEEVRDTLDALGNSESETVKKHHERWFGPEYGHGKTILGEEHKAARSHEMSENTTNNDVSTPTHRWGTRSSGGRSRSSSMKGGYEAARRRPGAASWVDKKKLQKNMVFAEKIIQDTSASLERCQFFHTVLIILNHSDPLIRSKHI